MESISFGPVPSRRLGASLGINNITPKFCSYSCIYCQLGNTLSLSAVRGTFHDPQILVDEVMARIRYMRGKGVRIDYLTFVPDGEPTLDSNLGGEIAMLKNSGIPVAVITNASLLWMEDVRSDLMSADWVSLKIDTVDELAWKKINRPHPSIILEKIMDAERSFTREYRGTLTTETMLVREVNDSRPGIARTSEFIEELNPVKSYISIPTRPPAEKWVLPPDETTVTRAYQIFRERIDEVECLTGYEGNEFSFGEDLESEILAITSVHPMREDAVTELLKRSGASWETIGKLIDENKLKQVEYEGSKFYMRRFRIPD